MNEMNNGTGPQNPTNPETPQQASPVYNNQSQQAPGPEANTYNQGTGQQTGQQSTYGQTQYNQSGAQAGYQGGYQQGGYQQGYSQPGQTPPYGGPSAYSSPAATPMEVNKWNWGAFVMSIPWGLGNKCYLTLLTLIPFFGFIWMFFCGAKGNQWAWETGNYKSVDELFKVQDTWNRAGFIYFFIMVGVCLLSIIFSSVITALLMSAIGSSGGYYY